MRLLLKLAILFAAAMLLHVRITVDHLNRSAEKLKSGEWTQADAEASGDVWNLNRDQVDPATQPTAANDVNDDNKDDQAPAVRQRNKAAGEAYRQASSSPARHRPGARSARCERCPTVVADQVRQRKIQC